MAFEELFDRRIPLALAFALLLQGGTIIWWAASKDSDDHFQQQRVEHLELASSEMRDAEARIFERLARIEERVNAEAAVLDRIDQRLGNSRR